MFRELGDLCGSSISAQMTPFSNLTWSMYTIMRFSSVFQIIAYAALSKVIVGLLKHVGVLGRVQCFFFSRNIGQLTPIFFFFIIYKNIFWIKVSKKIFHLNLKTEALVGSLIPKTPSSVLLFQPKYRIGHPENYLFLLSKKIFFGSKYPISILFIFENRSTAQAPPCVLPH